MLTDSAYIRNNSEWGVWMKRNGCLDFLKFVAAIVITCLYHYRNMCIGGALSGTTEKYIFENTVLIGKISDIGWMLVEFFFIVSGLLAYWAYFNKITEGEGIRTFYLKRCKRLLPMTMITTIVMAIGQWSFFNANGVYWMSMGNCSLSELLPHMLGVNIWIGTGCFAFNQPTWYISVCLFCYIVFWLIAVANRKVDRKWLFLVPVYCGAVVGTIGVAFCNPLMARGLLGFFIGVILAIFLEKNYSSKVYISSSIIVLIFVAVLHNTMGWKVFGNVLWVLEFFVFPAIIVLTTKIKVCEKIFNRKFFYYLGNISFGIYIWDIPIFFWISYINQKFSLNCSLNSLKTFWAILIIHIVVGSVSYEIIEKRLFKFIENVYVKMKTKQSGVCEE